MESQNVNLYKEKKDKLFNKFSIMYNAIAKINMLKYSQKQMFKEIDLYLQSYLFYVLYNRHLLTLETIKFIDKNAKYASFIKKANCKLKKELSEDNIINLKKFASIVLSEDAYFVKLINYFDKSTAEYATNDISGNSIVKKCLVELASCIINAPESTADTFKVELKMIKGL